MTPPRFCYQTRRDTVLCHHWWCAIKRKLWPCKHGFKLLTGGVIAHKTLLVSTTQAGNVYRTTIRCRRCQIVVMHYEGTIDERLSEEAAKIISETYHDVFG